MSSSDDEQVDSTETDIEFTSNQQVKFVTMLKNYDVLLEKSQLPSVKAAKRKALSALKEELGKVTGKTYEDKKLMKKINNMKSSVKSKIDKTKTGNRKIILKEWEKVFAELLQPKTNPTIAQIPGAAQAGLTDKQSTSAGPIVETPPPKPKKQKVAEAFPTESEETNTLINCQLQRLVMLEQLDLARMKKQAIQQKTVEIVYHDTGNSNLLLPD